MEHVISGKQYLREIESHGMRTSLIGKARRIHDEVVQDVVFLGLVSVLLTLFYVGGLGFYSDDWHFLEVLGSSDAQTPLGQSWDFYRDESRMSVRPVHALLLASLYWLFGNDPLGYHLANSLLIAGSGGLLYLTLRKLDLNRLLSLSIPLLYVTLPHYSTDRFWIAAFQANLSMILIFASLYAALRILDRGGVPRYFWFGASVVAFALCGLAYEIPMPLGLLIPAVMWIQSKRRGRMPVSGDDGRSWRPLALVFAAVLVGILFFKVLATDRLDDPDYSNLPAEAPTELLDEGRPEGAGRYLSFMVDFVNPRYDPYGYGLNIQHMLDVHFGELGIGLPIALTVGLGERFDASVVGMSLFLLAIMAGYLWRVAVRSPQILLKPRFALALAGLGIVVYVLGHVVFFTTRSIQVSNVGIANRTSVAGALGIAIWLIAIFALAGWLVRAQQARTIAVLVALFSALGVAAIGTVATYWVDASEQQHETLALVQQRFPELEPGTTLLVDGICSYAGPAPVFESQEDFAGALRLQYAQDGLDGSVINRYSKIGESGIYSVWYGFIEYYPYDSGTLLYNIPYDQITIADSPAAAAAHYARYNPDLTSGCPFANVGHGVPMLLAGSR